MVCLHTPYNYKEEITSFDLSGQLQQMLSIRLWQTSRATPFHMEGAGHGNGGDSW